VTLTAEQDAFGQALLAYFEDKKGRIVVERDDGFVDAEGVGAYFHEFRRWWPVERQVLRYVRGRVLDVGLGAGRVALELQTRGFDVVGIDISPLTVRVARRRGVKKTRVLALEDLDASLGRFDTVVFFMNNLGLLSSVTKAKRTLRRLHALTSDRGRIVGTCEDPHDTKRREHRAYHRRNRERGRMPGQLRLRLRYRSYETPWFDYLFVSPAELEALLEGTGWHIHRLIRREDDSFYAVVIDKD
jgi:SAM-dependent methyltransferase